MNNQIIAEAVEAVKAKRDPTARAETEAVREACRKPETLNLSGAPLFTNVEPCWMCAYAIRQTRVSRIVFGSRNAQIGGGSSKFPVLRDENLKSPAPEILAEILTAKD